MTLKTTVLALSVATLAGVAFWGAGRDEGFRLRVSRIDTTNRPDAIITSGFNKVDRLGNGDQPLPVPLQEMAQSTATGNTTTAAAGDAETAVVAKVDESALRYFASRGDTVRLQAEISRLRALYPNWVAPKDPLAVPQNEDKQLETMWQLYAESRYADVRKAIAARSAAEAGWVPPADLLDRLSVAEARAKLVQASDQKQYDTVVDLAADTTSLLTCSDIDVLWRVAEAFAATNRASRARDAYLYILNNCEKPEERLATIQKASTLLPYGMMDALLSRERTAADGAMEFESIRDDLARRFVAEGNGDAALIVAPQYLGRVARLAENGGLASDALLLAWYHLRRNAMLEAEKWFRRARDKEDGASASQGLALTLIARKEPREAEDAMFRWRGDSDDAKATYLAATANLLAIDPPAVLTADILQRIAATTLDARDAATAQQFGWYSRGLEQFQTAADWFGTALSWKPDDEASAYGLAITRQQLRDEAGVRAIQAQWASRSERIAALGEPEMRENRGIRLGTRGDAGEMTDHSGAARPLARRDTRPADAIGERVLVAGRPVRETATRPTGCSTTLDPRRLTPAAALIRGWCLMELRRPVEAAAAFEVALASPAAKTREDAAYGQSLAYLRSGLTANASVSATKMPQSRKRAAELQIAILTDRASAAANDGRYRDTLLILDQLAQLRAERVDLMVLRGYAYLNLKRYNDAFRVFEAAARTGNRDAMRGMADVRASQGGGRY